MTRKMHLIRVPRSTWTGMTPSPGITYGLSSASSNSNPMHQVEKAWRKKVGEYT